MAQGTLVCTQVVSLLGKKEDKVGEASTECQVLHGEHKKSSKISISRLCGLSGGSSKRTNPRRKNGPQRRVPAGLERGSWRAKQGWALQRQSRNWHMTEAAWGRFYPSSESLPQAGQSLSVLTWSCLFFHAGLQPLLDCSLRDQFTVISVSAAPSIRFVPKHVSCCRSE